MHFDYLIVGLDIEINVYVTPKNWYHGVSDERRF